jgi:hypothetical protein
MLLLGSSRGGHTKREAKSIRMCIFASQAVEGVKALVASDKAEATLQRKWVWVWVWVQVQ